MSNVYDLLNERGFIEQATHENEIIELLDKEKVTFYIGFDPTADSLHVGHLLQLIVMKHMQNAGHRPIVLLGGGTGMVGDPSGRTDMRQVLTLEQIQHNVNRFKEQVSRFIDFSNDKALLVDNSEWLTKLNYIDLLREVGAHFSVNRMLTAECFKSRMEKGLSFIEFNYMIMQSYDFLHLYRKKNCKLQFGGNDQWSNILGGVELIRRLDGGQAYGLTFKLLTNSEGKKMGKTASGAVWLDKNKMSPYDFYQYWRNIEDSDVKNCLSLLTFLPMDEVDKLARLEGAEINLAKTILAYEVTKLVHGEAEALKAKEAAEAVFGQRHSSEGMPHSEIKKSDIYEGVNLLSLFKEVDLIKSTTEGRNMMKQNGIILNDNVITDFNYILTLEDFIDNQAMLRRGKKKYHLLKLID